MAVPPSHPASSGPSTPSQPSAEADPTPASHRAKSRLTRRGLIGAASAVAAGAVVTPAVMAATTDSTDSDSSGASGAPQDGTTVETFPKTRSKAATGEAPVEAAFPIAYVGIRWEGTNSVDGGGIRLHDADGAGGDWKSLSGSGCSDANGGALLVPAGSASGYEVKAPEGATGLRSVALDTSNGPERKVDVPSDTTRVRGVAYLSRPAWGADESKRFKPDGTENTPTAYYPFQTITVHHTATVNNDPDPAATVRAIYELHAITNDWGDIGYHFLIDEEGRVYEGRYSGDDGIPAHDGEGKLVTAFHAAGYNSGNLGIALLGNLMEQGPTDAARASLTRLVRVLCRFHGLDPGARLTYTNPINGTQKDVPSISGHRDWMATECPGEVMYGELALLREAAAGRS
ncbi:peptidoglycan recognition protein family protein [Streptomyces himalayensis]|uniref:N-acetylmuramoyl-L-alanine amidase n=1 Tax=Streptomyces himalayensis subsp. himalayensis TaxID=2756131 RepID=A0A7W0I6K6_9ACTN|nr:peptidoglycan recognition family protein [Streptomyces himalayensis]MBA2944252.1 N-acetylmuramoyl-L-alanine amidase [Streptomyces himalayensis subsp. himalayensis]